MSKEPGISQFLGLSLIYLLALVLYCIPDNNECHNNERHFLPADFVSGMFKQRRIHYNFDFVAGPIAPWINCQLSSSGILSQWSLSKPQELRIGSAQLTDTSREFSYVQGYFDCELFREHWTVVVAPNACSGIRNHPSLDLDAARTIKDLIWPIEVVQFN